MVLTHIRQYLEEKIKFVMDGPTNEKQKLAGYIDGWMNKRMVEEIYQQINGRRKKRTKSLTIFTVLSIEARRAGTRVIIYAIFTSSSIQTWSASTLIDI